MATASSSIDLAVVERRLSVERLAPYRLQARGDLDNAIALYEWNARVAAAFWPLADPQPSSLATPPYGADCGGMGVSGDPALDRATQHR